MAVKNFYQLVDIPNVGNKGDTSYIDYSAIAEDTGSKTASILGAINYISLRILNSGDDANEADMDEIRDLSSIICDLADLGIATNKICKSASYYSGELYQKKHGEIK
ncbi:hypothetical protein KU75_21845 [Pectobacterium odoriferum]|uniref:Uncharacterized protein n=1 Tax=Pectobacterium odoriferum TaxID=78398 RepID=A0ABR4VJL1_9GAMM|nr:hypothetical protein [Pectobacterium odoriferum]KGA39555.1 hypothetical protein KU75_21845 [Pectobacterium odoriferum]